MKHKQRLNLLTLLMCLCASFIFPVAAYAATIPAGCPGGPPGVLQKTTVCPGGTSTSSSTIPAGCPGGPPGVLQKTTVCPGTGSGSGSSGPTGSAACGLSAGYATSGQCGTQVSDDAAFGNSSCSKEGSGDHCTDPDLVKLFINPAINLFSALVGVVCVASIIVGGIQYSSSAGDPQKAARARGRIINALIAIVAYAFLYGFLQFIIPGGAFQ